MDTDRRTEAAVGALFITATVGSILGSVALGSAIDGPDMLVNLASHGDQVIVAVALFLVAATSAFATSFLLFPILRRHAEGLAAGYVGLRAFENVFYVAGAISLLVMLTVSQDEATSSAAPTELALMGATLLAVHSWAVVLGTLIFAGLGCLTMNTVLYRARLVPRWLSVWGLLGGAGAFLYGSLGILGFETGLGSPWMLLAMPLAFQEMVFAGWLIVRGLTATAPRIGSVQQPQLPLAV